MQPRSVHIPVPTGVRKQPVPIKTDEDIKHGKTCHHWASPGRTCLRGPACKFVHAWIHPEKNGVCRNHLLGRCFYTENACYFQHLPIPIEEYETLAEGTKNYGELSTRVRSRLWEMRVQQRNSQQQNYGGSGPLNPEEGKRKIGLRRPIGTDSKAFTGNAFGQQSLTAGLFSKPAIGRELQKPAPPAVGQDNTRFMDQTFNPSWQLWANKNFLAPLDLEKSEKNNPKQLNTKNDSKTAPVLPNPAPSKEEVKPSTTTGPSASTSADAEPTAISSDGREIYIESETSDSDSSDETRSSKSCDEGQNSGNGNANVGVSSEESVNAGEPVNEKPLEQWSCNEVYNFIMTIGKSKRWKSYADRLKEEDVDGATLKIYQEPGALLEDFEGMKKGHARVIAKAISKATKVGPSA
mmetsp:Transcript_14733/g.20475  ORF Transcript_14733/g.20475 Transcript_14733/m.20475 type:complete len:408 (-) Transcript_14733:564-1787(-)